MNDMVGRLIGSYIITSFLGEGGMGTVWAGKHQSLDRQVAIKVLHSQYARNEKVRERFHKEASTLARLQHSNIVTLYDYIETENEICLVMEYVDGIDLSEMVLKHSGPISEDKLLPIFKQMLAGIGYAHKNNVIHRDIKPSNFIITKDGTVKVLDFGIAKLLEDDQQLTKTGMRLGTTTFMSPEQVDAGKVDHRTDIYSLGVTLFVLATGVLPYAGITSEFQVYNKIVNEPLPKASSVYPGVSPNVDRMIDKATEKNPSDRFQTCEEVLARLSAPSTNVPSAVIIAPRQISPNGLLIIMVLLILLAGIGISALINHDGSDFTIADHQSQESSSIHAIQTIEPPMRIGKQDWMTTNLNVALFRNGDPIPEAKSQVEWEYSNAVHEPAWCNYDNDSENGARFGKLYNGYAVSDARGLAPVGWHIPSNAEWDNLMTFLGGEEVAGPKMKSTNGWEKDGNGNNSSGFFGLPGGFCNEKFEFVNMGHIGCWWSASEQNSPSSWYRLLDCETNSGFHTLVSKGFGFSVRCIRD